MASEKLMRRFLLLVLPSGFHRIRHYGFLANGTRKVNLAQARALLHFAPTQVATPSNDERADVHGLPRSATGAPVTVRQAPFTRNRAPASLAWGP